MRRPALLLSTLSSAIVLLASCDGSTPLEPPTGAERATSAARGGGGGSELAAPSNLTATRSSPSLIDLAWRDNSGSETGFEIFRSTTGAAGPYALLTASGANTVAYADVGADSQKDHCYRIRAARRTGGKAAYSVFSSDACVPASPAAPPPEPEPPAPPPDEPVPPAPPAEVPASLYQVTARPLSSNALIITATWTGTSGAPAYRLYRSIDGAATWELIVASSYEPWLTDERPSEREACYRVVGYSDGGDAAPSNTACTTPPAGPTNLAGRMVSATTLELTWSDNSAVEDGYQVWMSTMYVSDCFNAGGEVDEILVAELPAGSTVYAAEAQALTCHNQAWYYLVAIRDGGTSDFSELVSAGP